MSWASRFITKVKPLLKPEFRGTKKKEKKEYNFYDFYR